MYESILTKYILPEIGNMKLGSIVKSNCQTIINNNFDKRRTCEQIRLTLSQIFEQALEDDLIQKIPTNKLIMPPKIKTDKRALTNEEKKAIISAKFTDKEKAFIYIIYFMGLRRCEALALCKEDFDFKKKLVTINKDLIFSNNKPIIEGTKNKYSERKIPIPENSVEFLKIYVSSIENKYLFKTAKGELITEMSYKRMWESIVKKINDELCIENTLSLSSCKGLTAYTFRHNYATMLYYSGISLKMAASYMGHRDTKMILDIYSHLDEEKEKSINKINQIKLD